MPKVLLLPANFQADKVTRENLRALCCPGCCCPRIGLGLRSRLLRVEVGDAANYRSREVPC